MILWKEYLTLTSVKAEIFDRESLKYGTRFSERMEEFAIVTAYEAYGFCNNSKGYSVTFIVF